MTILEKMAGAVIRGSEVVCTELANAALKEGIDPIDAIQEGFAKGMETVGINFECGKFYLPEMLPAAEAMNAGVKLLETVIASKGSQNAHRKGKAILARMGEGRPCRIGGFFQRREVIGFR